MKNKGLKGVSKFSKSPCRFVLCMYIHRKRISYFLILSISLTNLFFYYYLCLVCQYFVHVECQDFATPDCKETATYTPFRGVKETREDEVLIKHRWREGNLPMGAKCEYCKKNCSHTECLTGFQCEWCWITVSLTLLSTQWKLNRFFE